jgi:hypothetical protein
MRLLKKNRAQLLKTCLIALALGTAGTSWAMNSYDDDDKNTHLNKKIIKRKPALAIKKEDYSESGPLNLELLTSFRTPAKASSSSREENPVLINGSSIFDNSYEENNMEASRIELTPEDRLILEQNKSWQQFRNQVQDKIFGYFRNSIKSYEDAARELGFINNEFKIKKKDQIFFPKSDFSSLIQEDDYIKTFSFFDQDRDRNVKNFLSIALKGFSMPQIKKYFIEPKDDQFIELKDDQFEYDMNEKNNIAYLQNIKTATDSLWGEILGPKRLSDFVDELSARTTADYPLFIDQIVGYDPMKSSGLFYTQSLPRYKIVDPIDYMFAESGDQLETFNPLIHDDESDQE